MSNTGRRPISQVGNNGKGDGEDHSSLVTKLGLLERDLERRQESYVSRERAFKTRIDELETELSNQRQINTGWMKTDTKMSKLKSMQGQIINNVALVQDRTARILEEQERDLLRAFRARLFDVQTELEKEKSKKDDGAGAWIERCRQLEAEVEWAKEVSDRLERVNQTLLQENSRLKSQFSSQEEDRNFLIKQLVAVKKDNARLRTEYTKLEADNESQALRIKQLEDKAGIGGMTGAPRIAGGGLNSSTKNSDSEERYKEVNIRLRRLLADERRSLQQVRQNYATELKSRTEIELLLRQSVEDVRKEIAKRHIEHAQFQEDNNDLAKLYGKTPKLIPIENFSDEDRERAIELLLSQERVLTLLYSKSFPVNIKAGQGVIIDTAGITIDAELESELGLNERPNTASVISDKGQDNSASGRLPNVNNPRPNTGGR